MRVAQAVVVVEADGLEDVAVLEDQLDRVGGALGGGDGLLERVGRGGATGDGDDFPARGQALLEGRSAPDDRGDPVGLVHHEAERIGEVVAAQLLVEGVHVAGRLLLEDQAVAAALDAVERAARGRADRVQALAQEGGPVASLHPVQGRGHGLEGVGGRVPVAVLGAEEGLGEVVQRLLAAGLLADQGVGVEPDQRALAVVVLAALVAAPGLRPALADDGVVGGVLHGAPLAAGDVLEAGGGHGQDVQRLLLAHQTRAGGQDQTPVLRLALIDPQQGVLQRLVEVRRHLVGGAAPLAVPAVGVLVAQEVAVG